MVVVVVVVVVVETGVITGKKIAWVLVMMVGQIVRVNHWQIHCDRVLQFKSDVMSSVTSNTRFRSSPWGILVDPCTPRGGRWEVGAQPASVAISVTCV